MKKIATYIFMLLSALTAFAGSQDISEATHVIDINSPLPPVDPESVVVHTYKPTGNVKYVGKIYARGMATVDKPGELDILGILREANNPTIVTEEDDKRLAMEALLRDAANIGANAIIITKSYQASVSSNSTERRIEALAFRVLEIDSSATPMEKECQNSIQCRSGSACRGGTCMLILNPTRNSPPLGSVSRGRICIGDEHCQDGLYCSAFSGTCVAK